MFLLSIESLSSFWHAVVSDAIVGVGASFRGASLNEEGFPLNEEGFE